MSDCAVIGVPDGKWGEIPKALIVRASGHTAATEAEMIAYCCEHLASFRCPATVDWADSLPRNPKGKVLKKELRATYWDGHDRNVG